MNKIFRVIWNGLLQRYVVASELAKGKTKSQSSAADRPVIGPARLSPLAVAVTLAFYSVSAMASGTLVANGTALVVDGQTILPTGSGQNAWGINASNAGTVDFSHGTISTSAKNGYGAVVDSAAQVSFKNSDISTAGASSHGIYAKGNSRVTADGVNITTTGAGSYGVQTSNGDLTLSNSSIKTTAGMGAVAIGATGNIAIRDSTINSDGDYGHATYATSGGNITVDNSVLSAAGHYGKGAYANGAGSVISINNSTISTAGASAEAVYAQNGGLVNLTNTDINTSRVNAYGLRANGGAAVVNYDGGTITTTGATETVNGINGGTVNVKNALINSMSRGVLGQESGKMNLSNTVINSGFIGVEARTKSTVNLDNVTINNDSSVNPASGGTGIFAYNPGTVVNAKNVLINATGVNARGIQIAYGASATLDNIEINNTLMGGGIQAYSGSHIVANNVRMNINSQDDLQMSTGLAMGAYAGDNSVDLSNAQIIMHGANSTGLAFRSTAASNNTLALNNSLVSATEGTAILVTGTADTQVTTSGSQLTAATLLSAGVGNAGTVSNVTLTGDNGSLFNGDVVVNRADTDSNIINLDHASVWTGSTSTLANLNLSNDSQWNVTADSAVDNLTLNNATLNMSTDGSGLNQLTLGSLTSSNGTLNFNTRLGDDASLTDHLHITGDYQGDSLVQVQNAGGSGASTLNGIELIRVDGAADGSFTQKGRIVAGAYDYNLQRGTGTDGKNWYLRSSTAAPADGSGSSADTGQPVGSGNDVQPADMLVRPEAGNYIANLAAANTLFNLRLHDRGGETQYVDALTGEKKMTSLWMRNLGGHQEVRDNSGQLKTETNRYVLQLGGDLARFSSNGSDSLHLGAMAGYGNARSNTDSEVTGYRSQGHTTGYNLGLYGTWYQQPESQTGAWVDSWLQYGWFNNSVNGDHLAAEHYKSRGFTASLESGYSWKIGEDSEQNGYFIEPSAQLIWMGVKADGLTESNGTRVNGKGDGNLQSRVGVRASMKTPGETGQAVFKPYVEANWINNSRAFGTTLNGVTVSSQGEKNIAELRVGVDSQLKPDLNLWASLGQQAGSNQYRDSSAAVGVKLSF